MGVPPNHFNKIFHSQPSIFGHPQFRNFDYPNLSNPSLTHAISCQPKGVFKHLKAKTGVAIPSQKPSSMSKKNLHFVLKITHPILIDLTPHCLVPSIRQSPTKP